MDDEKRIVELDNIDIKLDVGGTIFNILYLRFAPPSRIKYIGNHCHSGYELHFIPYGRGSLIAGGKRYQVEPGTFYLAGPGVYHEQIADPGDPMAEYCLNFELLESRSRRQTRKGAYADGDMRRIAGIFKKSSFYFGRDEHDTIALFEKIIDEINKKAIGYYSVIASYLTTIIVSAARLSGGQRGSTEKPPEKQACDRRRFLADLYVQDRWNSRNVRDCADLLGVSLRQVDRIFKRYYGMSFREKLLSVRMDNAKKILVETSAPVKRVAELTGYEDFGYFCRVFKKSVGLSPSAYRTTLGG